MNTKKDAVQITSPSETTDDNGLTLLNGAKEIVGETPTGEGANGTEGTTPAVASDKTDKTTDKKSKKADAARLAKLEMEIADTALSFVVLGNDLREIREERLYRVRGYKTFDAYCQARWAMSRRYADFLIGGSDVHGNLKNNCAHLALPTNESQCRALAKLGDPERQVEVWAQAVASAGGKAPTAGQIKAVVKTRIVGQTPITPSPEVTGSTTSTVPVDPAQTGGEDEEVPSRTGAESDRPDRRREFADHDRKRDGEPQTADDPPFNGSLEPVDARVSPEDLLARLVKVVRVLEQIEGDIEGLGRDKGTRDDLLTQIDEGMVVLGRIRGRVSNHA